MKRMLAQIDFNQLGALTDKQGKPVTFFAGNTLGRIVAMVIPWIFTIAGMLLLVYLIFGGLQLMLSRGDPKAAGAAKSHITNALIGFIIIFVAYWITQLLGVVLGLTQISNNIGLPAVFK